MNGSFQDFFTECSCTRIILLVDDIEAVLGPHVAARNRGWIWRIDSIVPDDWIYSALSWLRKAMEPGGVDSPSASLTWKLRSEGAGI